MGFWRLGVATTLIAAVLTFASVGSAGAAPTAQIATVGAAPAGTSLHLVLPLTADLAGLRQAALAITTPGSPEYGAYVPLATLARRFGASAQTRRRVTSFLRHAGAQDVAIDPTGLFADATLSAGRAARLFATPLAQFRARGARFIAPAAEASATTAAASAHAASAARIPAGLAGSVTGVVGLDNRSLTGEGHLGRSEGQNRRLAHAASMSTSARNRTGTATGCAAGVETGGFTPNQYRTAYGYDGLRSAGLTGQGERVALLEVDGYKYSDLAAFAGCFGLPIPAIKTFGVGISKLLAPGGESTLDLEVLDAAAPGLSSINVFETKGSASDLLKGMTAPLRVKLKPQVVSASLGVCEPAIERFVGDNAIFSTEGALEMASASGVTFVASSGDQGSADCASNSGGILRLLSVNYPSSSWWVTGVGGTNFELNAANAITNQFVWNDAAAQPGSAGGGGTSDLFGRPNFQRGSTNANGRAVPDVSMLSDIAPGYAIYCSASEPNCISAVNSDPWEALGGTSAATPLLAGGLAIIDQKLKAAGKQPLGLVNPLLYAISRSHVPGVFADVTQFGNDVGLNIGSHRALGCCTARVGYDEASGLGSVNLTALAAAAEARQPPVATVSVSVPGSQHPVREDAIKATVGCSDQCVTGAYALVSIGRASPFEVNSSVVRLSHAGSKTLALHFTRKELSRLGSALARGTRVSAKIRGVLFNAAVYSVLSDPAGSITARTVAKQLTIGS
jgi:subtilase family serine protease